MHSKHKKKHTRRHHNTKGLRQIQNGRTHNLVRRLQREIKRRTGKAEVATPSPPCIEEAPR